LRNPESRRRSFDPPDFVVEPKIDGFRALAHVKGHRCELVSRDGHRFKSWSQLAEEIEHATKAHSGTARRGDLLSGSTGGHSVIGCRFAVIDRTSPRSTCLA
jgi:hypothetical protein